MVIPNSLVIFSCPLSKVENGTNRTAPFSLYLFIFNFLPLCWSTWHTDPILKGGARIQKVFQLVSQRMAVHGSHHPVTPRLHLVVASAVKMQNRSSV